MKLNIKYHFDMTKLVKMAKYSSGTDGIIILQETPLMEAVQSSFERMSQHTDDVWQPSCFVNSKHSHDYPKPNTTAKIKFETLRIKVKQK